MIPGSSKGPVPPTLAALVAATVLAWAMPARAESAAEPAEKASERPAAEVQAPAQVPAPEPSAPPATTALNLHATWDDRLVVESEGKNFYLQPIVILQSLFSLPYNSAAARLPPGSTAEETPTSRKYDGIGFTFRRAALGFDSRIFRNVRTFFLANIANGTLNLWDYFADLDYFDGMAVLRVGRFRPWLGRQRLLAGDRYQMIQLPSAMTDILEFGDGRDLGAGIFGLLARKTIEYQVGVWNGEQRYSNDAANGIVPGTSQQPYRGNIDFELGSRLVVHPLGYLPAFDESDFEFSEKPRLSVGAAAMFAKRHDVHVPSADLVYVDDRQLKTGVEIAFRWRGFSFEAEAFFRKSWQQTNPTSPAKREFAELGLGKLAKGAYAQAGMFVKPKLLELTARFDIVDVEPSNPGYVMRPAGGLNLFLHKYNVLLQLMYRANLARGDFKDDHSTWFSLRPADRTDVNFGNRPAARTSHDLFLMLQTSL